MWRWRWSAPAEQLEDDVKIMSAGRSGGNMEITLTKWRGDGVEVTSAGRFVAKMILDVQG